MPRVTSIRIGAIRSLVEQLRFARRDTLLRQVDRAEQLASTLDPAQNYPEDWIVHFITGYRPDEPEPAILVGQALLTEMSALVERLSDQAALRRDELSGEWLTLGELSERWGVSAKTIERWRRQGLIARRVRDPSGRASLVFAAPVVEAFERRRSAGVDRARRFRRLPPRDAARLVRAARLGARLFGWSLDEAARRLAPRYSVARETARQAFRRADAEVETSAFGEGGPLTTRERLTFARALRWGIEPAHIARRFARSRATVLRVGAERRADLLRRLRLPAAPPGPGLGARILEVDAVRVPFPEPAESTLAKFIDAARATPAPRRDAEDARVRAHALLLGEAGRDVARLARFAPSSAALDRIETALRWAAALRAALARDQLRVVLESIEARAGSPLTQADPDLAARMHAVAMDACLRAIAEYEPGEGRRLAGAIALAIDRALARAPLAGARADPSRARRAPQGAGAIVDWTRALAPWQRWLDPDPRLVAHLPLVPEPARRFIAFRYGLEQGPARTVADAAARAGVGHARALTLERAALRDARRAASAGATPPAPR